MFSSSRTNENRLGVPLHFIHARDHRVLHHRYTLLNRIKEIMKVICAKLTSGEEIIAKFVPKVSLTGTQNSMPTHEQLLEMVVTLEDVRQVVLQPMAGGRVGIEFMPWAIAASTTGTMQHTIDFAKHAMAVYDCRTELEQAYTQQTSTIQVVKNLPA
jgi:hypothetical protein